MTLLTEVADVGIPTSAVAVPAVIISLIIIIIIVIVIVCLVLRRRRHLHRRQVPMQSMSTIQHSVELMTSIAAVF